MACPPLEPTAPEGPPAPCSIAVALLAIGLTLALLVLEGLLRVAVPQWRGLVAQRFMTTTGAGVLAGVPVTWR